jgi:rSAM/selenodomain-associated transferase 1
MALLTNKNTGDDEDFLANFHYPTSKKAIIIFTRNPELGRCKTRLAATIGNESALEVYKFLLAHTVAITTNLNVDKFVFYSESLHKNDGWDNTIFRKKIQQGDDLGIRMQNAFMEIFSLGYEKAIIIGSDMYDLSQNDLETAFSHLEANDFVIGPAADGGYYLLGMKVVKESLFKNKAWGFNTVLDNTLKDLENESVAKLPIRNDVDYYEDIKDIEVFRKIIDHTKFVTK